MLRSSRITILVKALPQPSKRYGETVCCAGVTPDGEWKRLFPVRYRHLGGSAFSRWDWVTFDYRQPTSDRREESCHVHEESVIVSGAQLPERERAAFLEPLIVGSAQHAMERGQSLALIRPRNARFFWRPKLAHVAQAERAAFDRAARQLGMFDKQLAALDPTPYHFAFTFDDDAGRHTYSCGDWEVHAMFWNGRRRSGEAECLRWMGETFNEKYPARGMAFAIGNQAKRPRTWQLLGVIRLDAPEQAALMLR